MIKLDNSIGKNFCYAPWTNIHINPNGDYKTCCAGSTVIGNLKTIPINKLINSSELTQIKKSILNNQYHDNCKICIETEQTVSRSERHWYNDIARNKTLSINNLTGQHLQNLDIRWSNTCNLSCVYCDVWASSQWSSLKNIPLERIDYTNTFADILKFIKDNNSSLQQISLLGGEPLLQKENDLLLDVIPDTVTINIISNLNVPLENNKIFQKLVRKHTVIWDISFDTLEDRYEYVRHGSSWELLLKNLKILKDYTKDNPNHVISIASVYSVYNALRLDELFEGFEKYDIPPMRWNELLYPRALQVKNLPRRFIDKAIQQIEKSFSYTKNNQANFLPDMLTSLKNLSDIDIVDDCNYLYLWHKEQEDTYWPNFQHKFYDLWPEYRD